MGALARCHCPFRLWQQRHVCQPHHIAAQTNQLCCERGRRLLCACRSVCVDYTSDSISSPIQTTDVTPHLHIKLTPQGDSDVSLRLTVQDHAASSPSNTTVLSKQGQREYQDQLYKAQQTLLPQVMVCSNRLRLDAHNTCLC